MKNVNMVELLIGVQKQGINVLLTEDGLRVFLELMEQNQPEIVTQIKVG